MNILIELLVAIAIIWLVQTVLGAFEIKEPAAKIIFVIAIILVVVWLVSGSTLLLK
jgi:uncharacterized membrane protein YtjA (UPF0391 family)